MRGSSADEVAERVLSQPSLSGLQVMFQNGRILKPKLFISHSLFMTSLIMSRDQQLVLFTVKKMEKYRLTTMR